MCTGNIRRLDLYLLNGIRIPHRDITDDNFLSIRQGKRSCDRLVLGAINDVAAKVPIVHRKGCAFICKNIASARRHSQLEGKQNVGCIRSIDRLGDLQPANFLVLECSVVSP